MVPQWFVNMPDIYKKKRPFSVNLVFSTASLSLVPFPLLLLNKIGIEDAAPAAGYA